MKAVRPVDDGERKYKINEAMAIASCRQHGEFGATTKKPRICGLFDCVAHHRANSAQGPFLSVSAMDRGNNYDKIGMIVAYLVYNEAAAESQGKVYSDRDIILPGDPMPCESVLKHCFPIIRVYPGWKGNPITRATTELPREAQEFLGGIEHYTKAKVISIGVGVEDDDILHLKQ